MGQGFSQSDQAPTLEEFKDQLFGTLVFMLAPDFDSKQEFHDPNTDTSESESDYHWLPMIRGDFKEELRNYYLNNQDAIDEYAQNYILNSQDNAHKFQELLLKVLLDTKKNNRNQSQRQSQRQSQSQSQNQSNSFSDADTYAETERKSIPDHLRP